MSGKLFNWGWTKPPGGTEQADSRKKTEKAGMEDSPETTANETRQGAFPGKQIKQVWQVTKRQVRAGEE